MKTVVLIVLIFISHSYTQQKLSPAETAKIVVESFYSQDNKTLKKFTTTESYESFLSIQDIMTFENSGTSDFKILNEKINEDIAWVQFSTSYEDKPETFKLVLINEVWKVAEKALSEKTPF